VVRVNVLDAVHRKPGDKQRRRGTAVGIREQWRLVASENACILRIALSSSAKQLVSLSAI